MKGRAYHKKHNARGSAIIMALVTMTLLVCLGLGLIVVSMGNLNVSAADSANNDAYYAAEAGVNSAIEQLKFEVSSYYNSMLIAQGSGYTSLYNDFFPAIMNYASQHFIKPSTPDITTETTFAQDAVDTVKNTCRYLVSCTATANGMKYKVNGSLTVKRVDVQSGGAWNVPNDGNALIAGGSVEFGSNSWINVKNLANATISSVNDQSHIKFSKGGQLIFDPDIGLTINDNLKYPSYTVPPGVTEKGIVSYTGGDPNSDIYCTGFSSTTGIHGNIYCRGNVAISSGNIWGNIICDGSVSFSSATLNGTILAKNGITTSGGSIHGSLFSPAAITTSNTTFTHSIIYSSTILNIGASNSNGILFSGGGSGGSSGDIKVTGSPTFSLIIAKRNIDLSSNINIDIKYSKAIIQEILADPVNSFFTASSDPTLDEPVFLGQDVTPEGSIN
jgi:Tfp pilus assembly protein PilX